MRKAFTLIEVLVVIAIVGIMAGSVVMSLGQGERMARIRGATRDLFATIRQARSIALVTQQPSVITYSTATVDGEPCARVEITSSKMIGGSSVTRATTLSGREVVIGGNDEEPSDGDPKKDPPEGDASSASGGGGETIEEIIFAPVSDEVVKGMRLKVLMGDELLDAERDEERERPKISVFSNVDYLLGKFKESQERKEAAEKKEEDDGDSAAKGVSGDDAQGPVSVVWEVNGRCEPHRVWIYPDGSTPEKGLSIKVDRFGAAKVLGPGEDDR